MSFKSSNLIRRALCNPYKFINIKHNFLSLLPLLSAAYASFPLPTGNLNSRYSSAPLCYSHLDLTNKQTLLPNTVNFFSSSVDTACQNNPEKSIPYSLESSKNSVCHSTEKMIPSVTNVYRSDYTPCDFNVDNVKFTFDLDTELTTVQMEMNFYKKNKNSVDMFLNGEEMTLKEVKMNEKMLKAEEDYLVTPSSLTILAPNLPTDETPATLYTKVEINPKANLKLLGLYASGQMLCTQNEAEGFRRITYFFDRPDVMTKYTVKMTGNKEKFPVLLCNGNKIDYSEEGDNHSAVYEDPFPKPSYLFALVAGQLKHIASSFTTKSGKDVKLQIFSEPESIEKLEWAMESLKQSMKWDEDVFSLEYDLNEFNIVAVRDFNMGAMENKSLNIFNSAAVLASPKITTDNQYLFIRSVIAHEYFHNWTGDRVTCRDWFQLTLKEGLTVYRHQTFNYMVANPSTMRISDVIFLRAHQFTEDNGPMAHPIRPDFYKAIENFYTVTVYEKGAEVIRMYEVLLGFEGFKKGMDLYFKKHDGQAVTCDDFRAAMSEANNYDLTQFEQWYCQAGTPTVSVTKENYDASSKTYTITFKQKNNSPKNNPNSPPLMIPIKFGLIGKESYKQLIEPTVLVFNEAEQTFSFDNINEPCIPSLFRGFSAPIILDHEYSTEDSMTIAIYDTDAYTKWDAFDRLFYKTIYDLTKQYSQGKEAVVDPAFIEAFKKVLSNTKDKAMISFLVSVPSIKELTGSLEVIDLDNLLKAHKLLKKTIATELKQEIMDLYNDCMKTAEEKQNYHSLENEDIENRQLANTLLVSYITKMEPETADTIAFKHFSNAQCLTDKKAGINALGYCSASVYDQGIEKFYEECKDEPILLDAWFSVQASSDQPDAIERVEKLLQHKDFNLMNPNRMRSVLFPFYQNTEYFHDYSGKGYKILEDAIKKVDSFNSIMSSGLAKSFTQVKKMDEYRQIKMKESLKNILNTENLSKEVVEIVTNCLE